MKLLFDLKGSEELRDFLFRLSLDNKANLWCVNSIKSCPLFFFTPETEGHKVGRHYGVCSINSDIANNRGFRLTTDIGEVIKAIQAPFVENKELRFCNDLCIIRPDGSVTYGCTTLSKDTVDKIFSERKILLT